MGVLLPLEMSVLLTIAVTHFDAPGWARGTIAAANGVGLLASTFLTALARRVSVPTMTIAAWVIGVGAIGFAVAATGALIAYVIGVVVGVAATKINMPLLTATYAANYPQAERGKRVSRGITVKVAVSAPLALAMGAWLADRVELWRAIIIGGAVAALALSLLNARLPSAPLDEIAGERRHPWPRFGLLRSDPNLRLILGAWMLMGFGNLMLLPLRVDYLIEPEYGIEATATTVTLLTVAVPSVVRLLATGLFGRLFDRLSVYTVRITLNSLFLLYVIAFFSTTSPIGLWAGSVALGLAFAGSELMWMMWVTKFAPPDRTADYMGLHTFFTGCRAVAAPLFAYLVIARMSLGGLAILGAVLMSLSIAMLLPRAVGEERSRRLVSAR